MADRVIGKPCLLVWSEESLPLFTDAIIRITPECCNIKKRILFYQFYNLFILYMQ